MAFGDQYGYKTNGGFVPAVAESDVYDSDKVDLILVGFTNGRRKGVQIATLDATADPENFVFESSDDVPNNVALEASDVTQGKRDSSNPTAVGLN